mmetsp:Transcript_26349/g.66258  ORF Transcript_26349/g.66258 Transcript_26349/m.66258 type:complete len:248 (-) Transcript_26349:933-1676(-)
MMLQNVQFSFQVLTETQWILRCSTDHSHVAKRKRHLLVGENTCGESAVSLIQMCDHTQTAFACVSTLFDVLDQATQCTTLEGVLIQGHQFRGREDRYEQRLRKTFAIGADNFLEFLDKLWIRKIDRTHFAEQSGELYNGNLRNVGQKEFHPRRIHLELNVSILTCNSFLDLTQTIEATAVQQTPHTTGRFTSHFDLNRTPSGTSRRFGEKVKAEECLNHRRLARAWTTDHQKSREHEWYANLFPNGL